MPHDLYYEEWTRRKLRNRVHLNHAGCLGPCALANIAMLIFDGRPVWFHSLNSEALILAIFDYIDSMLAADRYLPPPAHLAPHVFNGFAWDGAKAVGTERNENITRINPPAASKGGEVLDSPLWGVREGIPESIIPKQSILLLTHADTDLLILNQAIATLPKDFPQIHALNLNTMPTSAHVDEFIQTDLAQYQVILLHSWGGRQGFAHGFDRLIQAVQGQQKDLICVPGTEGLDPELTAHSNVPVPLIHDTYRYLHYGGVENMRQLLHCLADNLLLGGYGYEQPVEQPRHGVYKPSDLIDPTLIDPPQSPRLGGKEQVLPPSRGKLEGGLPDTRSHLPTFKGGDQHSPFLNEEPTIGILFYRSHYLSGNTAFVDALLTEVEAQGAKALPVFTTSLKETITFAPERGPLGNKVVPAAFEYLCDEAGQPVVEALLCTISFAMGAITKSQGHPSLDLTDQNWNTAALEALGVPIVQAITSGMSEDEWRINERGLRPLDVAMNVALPEFDGRIISVPLSFKGQLADGEQPSLVQGEVYVPLLDRAKAIVRQAVNLAKLRRKANDEKRVAFILTNSNSKTDRIGNAVGLDAPASLIQLFQKMQEQGYRIDDLPENGDALLHALIERCSYDDIRLTEAQLAQAAGRVPIERYEAWFADLSPMQQTKMQSQWQPPPGEAYVHLDWRGQAQHLALAGLELGHIFLAIQPPRGYGLDPDAIYHTPDLPPTHHYYALYKWLTTRQDEGGWGADALVHMGKHGTLEWLPGKGIGLSQDCFPDTFLADAPLIYPFIINNPGEGAQAKRRAHAVIVDHMIPPMTSADVYGELALLTQLVDEYYQVEQMDPSKLPLIQQQIWDLMQQTNLDKDIATLLQTIDHGDHTHEWDGTYTDDGTPLTLAEMSATDFSHLLEDIDGYLCELGSLQIRDGLHILGHVPEGDQLCALLRALTRIPNDDIPSLRTAVADILGFDLEILLTSRGKPLTHQPEHLTRLASPQPLHTHADVITYIDDISLQLIQDLQSYTFNPDFIEQVIIANSPPKPPKREAKNSALWRVGGTKCQSELHTVLRFICTTLVPLLQRNQDEITHLLQALAGRYTPAGPAGAPTRGMAHILPTGRNFYAVDPQAIPSQAAWRVGTQLAEALLERYLKEEGVYPEQIGLSIWGTSAMRTQGDDIAQCFALLGVRPVWQTESRRITDIAIIPLAELGRPRIDVLMRISGFFRDAFPHLIDLMDKAVCIVAALDESSEQNFVRKHYVQTLAQTLSENPSDSEKAERRARYRLFGSKPGSYGAGILPLIDTQNWRDEHDLAEAYVNWGGYAYGQDVYGDEAPTEFKSVLSGVQIAVKNQDNREHDIFDSDDYLQYHGGMIATIRALNGRNPKSYFGDNGNPERAEVRTLQQEAYRVFRSRVVNPKWLAGIQRHGYKGALELAATVDYLFGYDATSEVVDDWMYEQTAQTYALDPARQAFFRQSNPWALQSITERLLEAAQRGMWAEPNQQTLDKLREVYLQTDASLEDGTGK